MIKAASLAVVLAAFPFAYMQAGWAAEPSTVDRTTAEDTTATIVSDNPEDGFGFPESGTWTVTLTTPGNVSAQLEAKTPTGDWKLSADESLAVFGTLSEAALKGAPANVTFESKRDSGIITFTGTAGNGSGHGTFTYKGTDTFSRAFKMPDDAQVFLGDPGRFFKGDAGPDHAIVRSDVSEIIANAKREAGPDSGAMLQALGNLRDVMPKIFTDRDVTVDQAYLKSLRDQGLSPTLDDAILLRERGIDAHDVAALKALGYSPTVAQLIRLNEHGMTPERIKRIRPFLRDSSLENVLKFGDTID